MNEYPEDFPYRAPRMPVMARNMVASSQPLAVQAGIDMLRRGGNAVDAALATAITLTVVEPNNNGIGSDAFCILWDGENLHGLNASGRCPAAVRTADFSGLDEMPLRGWDSVTVPGCVSAWTELSKRFGKLSFETLFRAAIDYADNGFMVSPITANSWSHQQAELADFEYFQPFLPGGRAPLAGELFRFPDQARSLESIAATVGESFYRGELAEKIVATARHDGAKLAMSDLENHQVDWVELISQPYGDCELHEIPPNGQGLAALIALGILQYHDIARYPVDSADSVHCQVEAMKLAFADAFRYISDPDHMDIEPTALLDPDYLASRARLIDKTRAAFPDYGVPGKGDTVYLSTADQDGMMVSMIQSNFEGFGSGIVIPGTGISLQNRGAGFVVDPGHPNCVDGGKRPFHTIIPGFLTRQGQPLMSFGVMGGHMQAQGHVQMVLRICDYGQNPQAANDAPRWRLTEDNELKLEDGFDPSIKEQLVVRGHRIYDDSIRGTLTMGGAQLILKTDYGYIGGTEHRKDGQAAGY